MRTMVGEDLADEGEADKHSGVGVAGPGERLLEWCRLLPASYQLKDVPAAELDGDNRQQEDARGRLGFRREDQGRFHRSGPLEGNLSSSR